jgi:hypothetical protein
MSRHGEHPAEELETDVVPFAEGFAALRRIGLHQTAVTVRQVHGKEVDLPLHPADHRQRFAEVDLCVPGSWRNGTNISRSRWRLSVSLFGFDDFAGAIFDEKRRVYRFRRASVLLAQRFLFRSLAGRERFKRFSGLVPF